jgi:hypothetical protein
LAELPESFLTIPEAAGILQVPEETIHGWIRLRALPIVGAPDGGPVVRAHDLLELVEPLVAPELADVIMARDRLRSPLEALAAKLAAPDPMRLRRESRARPLFHYTTATVALDHILLEARLRLSSPTGTNDPGEFEEHNVGLIQDRDDEPWPPTRVERDLFFHGSSNLLRNRCRLACLSTAVRNERSSLTGFGDGYARARMWAQYADNHAGVCLAFDQKRLTDAAIRLASSRNLKLYKGPVRYLSDDETPRPTELPISRLRADFHGFIDEVFPTVVGRLYFMKAWDWSTESEYRFLVHGEVDDYEYVDISRSLTGILCGSRFPDARLSDLAARCPQLMDAGRIFRLQWRNGFPLPMPVNTAGAGRSSAWEVPPPPHEPNLSHETIPASAAG